MHIRINILVFWECNYSCRSSIISIIIVLLQLVTFWRFLKNCLFYINICTLNICNNKLKSYFLNSWMKNNFTYSIFPSCQIDELCNKIIFYQISFFQSTKEHAYFKEGYLTLMFLFWLNFLVLIFVQYFFTNCLPIRIVYLEKKNRKLRYDNYTIIIYWESSVNFK